MRCDAMRARLPNPEERKEDNLADHREPTENAATQRPASAPPRRRRPRARPHSVRCGHATVATKGRSKVKRSREMTFWEMQFGSGTTARSPIRQVGDTMSHIPLCWPVEPLIWETSSLWVDTDSWTPDGKDRVGREYARPPGDSAWTVGRRGLAGHDHKIGGRQRIPYSKREGQLRHKG